MRKKKEYRTYILATAKPTEHLDAINRLGRRIYSKTVSLTQDTHAKKGYQGTLSNNIYFIIRLDATGIPERLEYHQQSFLITNPSYFTQPRDDLKLY